MKSLFNTLFWTTFWVFLLALTSGIILDSRVLKDIGLCCIFVMLAVDLVEWLYKLGWPRLEVFTTAALSIIGFTTGSLLIATQDNYSWYMPVVLAVALCALYKVARRNKLSRTP